MATVEVTITGDIANVVDEDFQQAQVRLRANTPFIADRDGDKIRVLDRDFTNVELDGTFSFANVVATTDTITAGTLQYYVDLRCRTEREWIELTLGPYVLSEDADLSDLEATQPTGATRETIPNEDVLAASQNYTDDVMDNHEAASNPHPVYARFVDVNGAAVSVPIILATAGSAFPAVVPGGLLFFGGN